MALDPKRNPAYEIKAVNVLKALGKSAPKSVLIQGYKSNCTVGRIDNIKATGVNVTSGDIKNLCMKHIVESGAMADVKRIFNAIEASNCTVGSQQMPKKIRICARLPKGRIENFMATGVNVTLSSGYIEDLGMKYLLEAGADLKRIIMATGFEAILIKGLKASTAASIILRLNDFYCDQMERSVHDAFSAMNRVLEGKKFVAGGGCVEATLSIHLENFAISLSLGERLAIAEFAESLFVIPKTVTYLVAKLRACHKSSQAKLEHTDLKWYILDLIDGIVKVDVLEPALPQ